MASVCYTGSCLLGAISLILAGPHAGDAILGRQLLREAGPLVAFWDPQVSLPPSWLYLVLMLVVVATSCSDYNEHEHHRSCPGCGVATKDPATLPAHFLGRRLNEPQCNRLAGLQLGSEASA